MVHRIDSEGAVDGRFQPGDAGTGLRATRHDFAWLNAQQEEILGIVEAEGLTPTKGTWTQLGDAITKRIGRFAPIGIGKSYGLNGGFRIWQRGTSFTHTAPGTGSTNVFNADRFMSRVARDGTATISQAFRAPGAGLESGSRSYLAWTQTVASNTDEHGLFQRVDALEELAGQTITFSVQMSSGSGSLPVQPLVRQRFGSGESADVITYGSVQEVAASGWTRIEMSLTVPSIVGKTIGTTQTFVEFGVTLPLNTTYTVNFDQFVIEAGDAVTAYREPPVDLELALVRQYYQKSYPDGVYAGDSTYNGSIMGYEQDRSWPANPNCVLGANTQFGIPMRAVPTITWYAPILGTSNFFLWGANNYRSIVATYHTSRHQTGVPSLAGASSTAAWAAHWIADAEIKA